MRRASCDAVWDSLSLTGLCISLILISPVLPSPFCNPLSCLCLSSARTWCTPYSCGKPAAPGIQATGPHRTGTGICRKERHDVFWSEPSLQLQRHRVVYRAVAHRADEAWHGEVLEAQQRWVFPKHVFFNRPKRHQHLFTLKSIKKVSKRSILSAILDRYPTNTVEIFGFWQKPDWHDQDCFPLA